MGLDRDWEAEKEIHRRGPFTFREVLSFSYNKM